MLHKLILTDILRSTYLLSGERCMVDKSRQYLGTGGDAAFHDNEAVHGLEKPMLIFSPLVSLDLWRTLSF